MKRRNIILSIALIFLITLAIRLFFAFQTPYFSDPESYFHLRQIEHIKQTGLPLFEDKLSYGGRTLIFLPLFHYILAIFIKFLPATLTLKILINLFASSLIIIVYLITKQITKNTHAALFTAAISAFIPSYFKQTFNSITPLSLVIPLSFLLIYTILRINEKNYSNYFILVLCILMLSSATSFLLVLALGFYLLLTKIEKVKIESSEIETILFSIFFILWFYLLVFKKAFLSHSYHFIWQNIPAQLISNYFYQINILEAIYQIGIIPFMAGIYIIYIYLFRQKNKAIYLLTTFAMLTTILLWFRLLTLELSMIYLGIILVLLFGQFYKIFFEYIAKTRFAKFKNIFFTLVAAIFILTSIVPSISYAQATLKDTLTVDEAEAFLELDRIADNKDIIISTFEDGHYITYFLKRRIVADSNFLFVQNIDQKAEDIKETYTTHSTTRAVSLLNKYKVNYLVFSRNAKKAYDINELHSFTEQCFHPVYNRTTIIYKITCIIEEK